MSDIFAIRNDGINYKELDLEIMDINRHRPASISLDAVLKFNLLNTAMKSWWVAPETRFINIDGQPELPIPDVSRWIDATLVLSPKAYRLLKDLLEQSGEFLPVTVGVDTYYIFNCLIIGETDDNKCEFEYIADVKAGLTHLEFKQSAKELTIFKTPLESCLTLFCNARFKEIIENYELEGIVFDKHLIEVFE